MNSASDFVVLNSDKTITVEEKKRKKKIIQKAVNSCLGLQRVSCSSVHRSWMQKGKQGETAQKNRCIPAQKCCSDWLLQWEFADKYFWLSEVATATLPLTLGQNNIQKQQNQIDLSLQKCPHKETQWFANFDFSLSCHDNDHDCYYSGYENANSLLLCLLNWKQSAGADYGSCGTPAPFVFHNSSHRLNLLVGSTKPHT